MSDQPQEKFPFRSEDLVVVDNGKVAKISKGNKISEKFLELIYSKHHNSYLIEEPKIRLALGYYLEWRDE